MKDWDDFTPFQKWFYGCGACADGDLEQDAEGNYTMPLTQVFYDCWCAAGGGMTNSEYETASITAAGYADKFEGEHKLKQCDQAIAVLEESLARLQAERREIVNRYDLNKCEHSFVWHMALQSWWCSKCGATK